MIRVMETRNLIGGSWRTSARSIRVADPATDEVLAEVPGDRPPLADLAHLAAAL